MEREREQERQKWRSLTYSLVLKDHSVNSQCRKEMLPFNEGLQKIISGPINVVNNPPNCSSPTFLVSGTEICNYLMGPIQPNQTLFVRFVLLKLNIKCNVWVSLRPCVAFLYHSPPLTSQTCFYNHATRHKHMIVPQHAFLKHQRLFDCKP